MKAENLKNGQEQYEKFWSSIRKGYLVQYDYRFENGQLFSCVKPSLELCRKARADYALKYADTLSVPENLYDQEDCSFDISRD